jgi:hypothetical protein
MPSQGHAQPCAKLITKSGIDDRHTGALHPARQNYQLFGNFTGSTGFCGLQVLLLKIACFQPKASQN